MFKAKMMTIYCLEPPLQNSLAQRTKYHNFTSQIRPFLFHIYLHFQNTLDHFPYS